jgi:hypothetical protein
MRRNVRTVASKITAFLTARSAYEADNSTEKRIAKDEAKNEIFGKETLASLPSWFLILTLTLVTYIFGIIISNISSLLIEKIIVKNIHFLDNFVSIGTILSENTFRLFNDKVTRELGIVFCEKDIRLIITKVENHTIHSYNTVFVFLTIYGTNRNLCCIFLLVGLISFIVNIIRHCNIVFPIVLIILSIISLFGYIRFYRYFISHLVSAYLT